MIKIATSILSSKERIKCIKELNNTTTDYIHIDVMDGIFVPNYQLPIEEVNMLGRITEKPFDIHLMVNNPKEYINKLNVKNIKAITIHIEIKEEINDIIDLIKSHGYEAGLAIKPNTNINVIDDYINKVDKVIIMSVEPGFGGQKFIENTIERIKAIRNKRNNIIIEVDGGINNETITKINKITDIAVAGSYITNNNDYQKAINSLKN